MKETIQFFYNIDVDDIEEQDGKYHFKYNNRDYFFVYYNRLMEELDDIIMCVKNMQEKGINVNDIIFNKDNSAVTKVGKYY